jgi:hypothetical protein
MEKRSSFSLSRRVLTILDDGVRPMGLDRKDRIVFGI